MKLCIRLLSSFGSYALCHVSNELAFFSLLQLWVFTSTKPTLGRDAKALDLVFRKKDLLRDSDFKV